MKKEEALNKWCPFARVSRRHGGGNFNRYNTICDTVPPECLCIAGGCMMWVWDIEGQNITTNGYVPIYSETNGHCGLAREPYMYMATY